MEQGEDKDWNESINKFVWGLLYIVAFLAAIPTLLDTLSAIT